MKKWFDPGILTPWESELFQGRHPSEPKQPRVAREVQRSGLVISPFQKLLLQHRNGFWFQNLKGKIAQIQKDQNLYLEKKHLEFCTSKTKKIQDSWDFNQSKILRVLEKLALFFKKKKGILALQCTDLAFHQTHDTDFREARSGIELHSVSHGGHLFLK